MEPTKKIIKIFYIRNGEEITNVYLESDVVFSTCVFEKFVKVSIIEFGINPLYSVSLPGFTNQCRLY